MRLKNINTSILPLICTYGAIDNPLIGFSNFPDLKGTIKTLKPWALPKPAIFREKLSKGFWNLLTLGYP